MSDQDLFKMFIQQWQRAEERREVQAKSVALELRRNRRVSRRLIKEVTDMNAANKAMRDALEASPQQLAKIAHGVKLMFGVIVLHLFATPILGSDAVRTLVNEALKRVAGVIL